MTDLVTAATPLLQQWSAELATRSGLRLYVRPVARADNDLVDRFYASLTADDLRFRFLSPISHPSSSLLEALVAVDHVRTEDFLVFTRVNGELDLVASAMLAADPSLDRAEVAIAVRPDYKSKGIGWTLLDFVSHDAQARGIKTLESIECRDNSAAITLEKEKGFSAEPYPGDASLTLLRKRLSDRN
ncbi:MAG: GNAT family N-acetyltransferase [Pirellulales bacterium]